MYMGTRGLGAFRKRRGMGYVDINGVQRVGPAPDPSVPVPDQTQNQIAYLWDAVFGEHGTAAIDPGMSVPPPPTQWIPGIPNMVTGVLGAAFGLVLIKAMR